MRGLPFPSNENTHHIYIIRLLSVAVKTSEQSHCHRAPFIIIGFFIFVCLCSQAPAAAPPHPTVDLSAQI